MKDRHPRTLQEAFGPYTSSQIGETRRRAPAHEWVLYALAVVTALLGAFGWLA